MKKRIEQPSDIFHEVIKDMTSKYGKPPELPIDFLPYLNNRIWGMRKKELVVVGGRTSMGKSVLMLQLAHSFAKQQKKTVFISLEMTIESCIQRLMNDYCSINNWVNVAGMSPEAYEKNKESLVSFYNHLKAIPLLFMEGHGKTFGDLFETLEDLDTDVDAVFIDYIQMIKSTGMTDKQAIDEYIKKLRNYAIEKNFCAVIGSQINRGTYDSSKITYPEIWQLKGSGALEEIMDLCFLVHYQHHYTKEETDKNEFWLSVAKNRGGRTGNFNCTFEPEFGRISQKEKDDSGTQNPSYFND